MKKIKAYFVFLLLLSTTFFISCGNNVKAQPIDQGKLALNKKEYDKALSSFQLAIDKGSNNKEALDLIDILDNFLKAKESLKKDELDKAKEYTSKINGTYKDYSIKGDIEQLVKEVNEKVQALEAKKNKANNLSKDITQNTESKIQLYLDKLNNLDSEISIILSDNKYTNGTTFGIREGMAIKYEKWDGVLNEIYGDLIKQLPQDKVDVIRNEQVKWISIRDSKADESSKGYEGGTMKPVAYSDSLGESTKERCYELVNKYMK